MKYPNCSLGIKKIFFFQIDDYISIIWLKSTSSNYVYTLLVNKIKKAALKELAIRNDIFIIKADKGEAVIIIDVKDYVKEAEHQLQPKNKGMRIMHYAVWQKTKQPQERWKQSKI